MPSINKHYWFLPLKRISQKPAQLTTKNHYGLPTYSYNLSHYRRSWNACFLLQQIQECPRTKYLLSMVRRGVADHPNAFMVEPPLFGPNSGLSVARSYSYPDRHRSAGCII